MKDANMKQNSPMVSSNSRIWYMHKTCSLWDPESPSLNSRCRPGQPMLLRWLYIFIKPTWCVAMAEKRANRLVGERGWGAAGKAKDLWPG